MSLDKDLINQLVKVTSRAAISCYQFLGKENKKIADKAATDSMRNDLNNLEINGEVVIGEGELDEAPMLYIGEKLGTKNGPEFDIAVDPLEGTNFAANNLPGALSVIAIGEKNSLFNAPETYMEKISARVSEKNVIDLDYTVQAGQTNISSIVAGLNASLNTAGVSDKQSFSFRGTNLILSREKLNINSKNLNLLIRQVENDKIRRDRGQITNTDLAQSGSSLAGAQAQFAKAKSDLLISKLNYENIIGKISDPNQLQKNSNAIVGIPNTLNEAINLSKQNSPDIQNLWSEYINYAESV